MIRVSEQLARRLGVRTKKKRHKFGAVAKVVDGIKFPSRAEARRWTVLRQHERIGNITGLVRQIAADLVVNGEHVCQIIWDFVYVKGGVTHCEDVKGAKNTTAYALYRVKAKLFMALHPSIVVVETQNGRPKQISRDRGGEDPARAREGRTVRRPRKRPARTKRN